MTICAAHQKWKDDELDEGPLRKCGAKVGKWLLNSRWEKAKTELTATGFPFQKVTALLQQQSELERELETELEQELAINNNNNNKKQQHLITPSGDLSSNASSNVSDDLSSEVLDGDVSTIEMAIEKASRPTALSYSEIVQHLAPLAFVSQSNCNTFGNLIVSNSLTEEWEEKKAKLKEIGQSLGRMVYVMDAYEDLESDHEKGRFNVLLKFWEGSSRGLALPKDVIKAEVGRILEKNMNRMWESLEGLPLQRYNHMIQYILGEGLEKKLNQRLNASNSQSKKISIRIKRKKLKPVLQEKIRKLSSKKETSTDQTKQGKQKEDCCHNCFDECCCSCNCSPSTQSVTRETPNPGVIANSEVMETEMMVDSEMITEGATQTTESLSLCSGEGCCCELDIHCCCCECHIC